ncbi:MAG TPA: hypothetical protein VGG27_05150 [Magnetospirillaceae bacterium]|jgi:hypothetical protein
MHRGILARLVSSSAAVSIILSGVLAGLTTAPARADDDFHHDRELHPHPGPGPHPHAGPGPGAWWHGDIHHFGEHDLGIWRGGRWFHGPHDGRPGWWWIVGGVWYFYPAPVYPFPNPYVPPGAVVPPPVQYYYYCGPAQAYYPQVGSCPVQWQAVPATAAAPPG